MGNNGRPVRSSKARALNKLEATLQFSSDEEEFDHNDHRIRRNRSRRGRNTRNSIHNASSEEEALDFDEHVLDQNHPDDVSNDPSHFVQYNPPRLDQSPDRDSNHDDDLEDANDNEPLTNINAYIPPQKIRITGSIVTKSGRVSKPPQQTLQITTSPRPRRVAINSEHVDTREQRVLRRRRKLDAGDDADYHTEQTGVGLGSLRQAKPSNPLDEIGDDDADDEHLTIPPSAGPSNHTRLTRSRIVKLEERQPENGLRRGTGGRSVDQGEGVYDIKTTSVNGVERPTRQTRSRTRSKPFGADADPEGEVDAEAEGEAERDGDFPSPGTGDESADQEMDDALFQEEQDAVAHEAHAAESDSEAANIAPRRSRRNRKTQPRRSAPVKRTRRSTRVAQNENPMARETRKSYRPRSESLRPSDFYADAETGSDDSVSSAELRPSTKRSRPTRAAASRAGDVIANKLAPVDYLQNPMATIDAGMPVGQSISGRYSRRKSRLRPTGTDPFPSDDDGMVAGGMTTGIEPIQVDLNLSWNDVGGLDHHVRALKEMVALPLMYPEVFEKFKMEAPKGVLFYGPPGTGKTLCARALAASCGGDPVFTSSNTDGTAKPAKKDTTVAEKKESHPAAPGPEATTQIVTKSGDIKREEPNFDVVMMEPAGNMNHIERNGSGFDEPAKSSGNDALAVANGYGPEVVADEHAAVVSHRSKELHDRITTSVQDGDTAGAENRVRSSQVLVNDSNVRKKPRVAFFMRNGADCLSKWVGEAERQLRMTFEAAKKHQPSIIFFDEIDGLAPVRSSRQDQIHSSIVSTLLGLMDGLDARGQVVVIGATNRVDAIDPALRRPGRFDRELIFTLPNAQARRKILGIHTAEWTPPPALDILDVVARLTVGYCGADLKSLCSESALRALRRRYPQIYESKEKLVINPDEVVVTTRDFLSAMKDIVPASHRSARTHARPISERLGPILNDSLESCMATLKRIFPQGLELTAGSHEKSSTIGDIPGEDPSDTYFADTLDSSSEDEDEHPAIKGAIADIVNAGRLRNNSVHKMERYQTLRPRMLICGEQGLGQGQLGPAILHQYESCPVHAIDYPSLMADAGSRCPEEALMCAFREAIRSVPSILYLSHLQLWWESATESLKTTLVIALKDIPADLPLLVLATAEKPLNRLPQEVVELFGETIELSAPSEASRREMFTPLLDQAAALPKFSKSAARFRRKRRRLELLPKAPPSAPKLSSPEETMQKVLAEDRFIRRLRMEMRAFVEKLLRDRKFKAFWEPVDPESAPDYYDIIKTPMDISKIASQTDLGKYPTVLAMVNDFEILVKNAIQYNPPNTENGALILRRAHGLIDLVHAWVDNLNPMLVETCNKIIVERVSKSQKELAANLGDDKMVQGIGQKSEAVFAKQQRNDDAGVGNSESGAAGVRSNEAVVGLKRSRVEMETKEGGDGTEREDEDMRTQRDTEEEDGVAPSVSDIMDVEPEEAVPASMSDLMWLKRQMLAVSTGVTVDGLENLYMKCATVLRKQRRCMDRNRVVKTLIETVSAARDDPAVVGKLVE